MVAMVTIIRKQTTRVELRNRCDKKHKNAKVVFGAIKVKRSCAVTHSYPPVQGGYRGIMT